MGFLRLLLAVAVVIDHSAPFFCLRLTGGRVAVQLFYMISGYYMALVLASKYTGRGSYGRFLANRCLRLFPSYWAIAILTLMVSLVARAMIGDWGRLEPWVAYGDPLSSATKAVLAVTNAVIVGQDALMFTGLTARGDSLTFVTDFSRSTPPVYEFLLVPQAWSLSVELMFYLVAPFLLRQHVTVLLLTLLGSLGLRVWLATACGLSNDPWTYRFFPCELGLFTLGALAFRLTPLEATMPTRPSRRGHAAIVVMAMLIVSYPVWIAATDPYRELARWAFYGCFFVLLPVIFNATRFSKLDRTIGELSYPLYVCHVLVVWILKGIAGRIDVGSWLGELAVVGSLAFAYGMVLTIIDPIDRWRATSLAAHR